MITKTRDGSVAKKFVQEHTELFETMVVLRVARDPDFFLKVRGVLCRSGEAYENHFETTQLFALYIALDGILTAASERVPPPDLVRVFLETLAAEGTTLSMSAVPEVVALYVHILTMDAEIARFWVDGGFYHWITRKTMQNVASSVTRDESWEPSSFHEMLGGRLSEVKAALRLNKTMYSASELFDMPDSSTDRVESPWRSVSEMLGGGFGRKEHVMFIAPTGAGKTVAAAGITCNFAKNGEFGVMVSTEQHPVELLPRFLSAELSIPFSAFLSGAMRAAVPQEKMQAALGLVRVLDTHVVFEHYDKSSSDTLELYMRDLLKRAEGKLGRKLTFVVFDWIGGALVREARNDPSMIRHLYQSGADYLAEISETMDLRCVSFAQASPSQTKETKRVGLIHLTECKTMGNNVTAAIGISGRTAPDSSDGAKAEQQYFYADKTRKGQGRTVPMLREFKYQRFKEGGS